MGDYLKSSLRYTATLDRREPGTGGAAATLGGPGWALRSTTELAGLAPPDPAEPGPAAAAAGAAGLSGSAPGGTLRYLRQQVDASMVVPMDPQGAVVFNLGATAGGPGPGAAYGPAVNQGSGWGWGWRAGCTGAA